MRKNFLKSVHTKQVKKILIIRNGLIGDLIFISSSLNRLVNTFPKVEIDLVIGPTGKEIIQYFPNINRIFSYKFSYNIIDILKQIIFFRNLSKNKYDIVIVHEVNTHFTILSQFVKAKHHIGFKNKLSFLYDYHINKPPINAVLSELELVKYWTMQKNIDKSYLYIPKELSNEAYKKFSNFGLNIKNKYVVLNPTSNIKNSVKDWIPKRWAELADRIVSKTNFQIVFNGDSRDGKKISEIQSYMKHDSISFCGKNMISLIDLMALIKKSVLVISLDTGPAHIASAFDRPVIVLMGYTDWRIFKPYSPYSKSIVIKSELKCSPCENKNPKPKQWEICLNRRPVVCMEKIEARLVFKKAHELLI